LLSLNVQLVMLARGDSAMERFFKLAEARYPENLRAISRFDNALAHRLQAGSDMFLMPSRFEPCGLTQMYAFKYGTVPIVRATGGLRDTVSQFDPTTLIGNGFVFEQFDAEALIAAVSRAANIFRKPPIWRQLMSNCFKADFSWARAARQYLDWFEQIRTNQLP
jgi:starch synthase